MSMQLSVVHTPIVVRISNLARPVRHALDFLTPVADLALRLWVAKVFFLSGLTKVQSFDTTIQLFTYEYHTPLLSPLAAAYAGTFTELFFPVLLALGLAGRFSALVLFAFNILAVVSYPDLNAAGLRDHQVWGLMLFVTLCHGPGKISLDHFLSRFWNRARPR